MSRILVIEDNLANLDLMTYLLRAFGHTPLTARDGEEGLKVVRRESLDLIVCDVHLPGVDGYEVAQRLKGHPALRQVPLVAVTAMAMVGDRERVLAAGFDGYIPKPIVPETFVGQVEAFLRPDQQAPPPQTPDVVERPANDSPDRPPPPGPGESLAGRTRRPPRGVVLVVDNSPVNRELIRSALEPSGYEVLLAGSAQEGLALAWRSPPDLVLSDLHMPGEDGLGFIRAVKADPRLCSIPFLFISASIFGEKDREAGLALGATRFITRPIEPQALLKEIEVCLKERS